MQPPIQPRNPRAGFTLIELITIVVILTMLVGTVSLSWQRILPRQRLQSDVRTLGERIHGARSDAISRSTEVWFHYRIDEGRYWMTLPLHRRGSLLQTLEVEEGDRVTLHEGQLSDGVSFARITIDDKDYGPEDGEVYVRFDALGSSSAHQIVLHQPAYEAHFTIDVQALTGLIDFHEGIWRREEARDEDFN